MRWHAVAQGQGGEERSAKDPCHSAVHQRDGRVDGGDCTQRAEQAQPRSMESPRGEREERQGEEDRGDDSDSAHIAADAERLARASEPSMRRRLETDPRFERTTTTGEEMIARIAPAPLHHARACTCSLLCCPDCAARDIDLRVLRTTRQLLDGVAVEIAGREIHLRKAAGGEYVVDEEIGRASCRERV